MEVYIEYAIIDNLIMDFLLLKGTSKLTKTAQNNFRIAFGSIVATIIAVLLPIFKINDGISFIIKIILAMLVCLISAEHKTIFSYLKFLNVFVLLTFIVGGMIIGVLSIFGIEYSSEEIKKVGVLPIGVNFLVMVACYQVITKFVKSKIDKMQNNFICDIEITSNNKNYVFTAFVDSGNTLTDAKSNLPVLVCQKSVIDKLFYGEKPKRYMPISTASGLGDLALYDIDKVTITVKGKRRIFDGVLGYNEKHTLGNDFDILIGAFFI